MVLDHLPVAIVGGEDDGEVASIAEALGKYDEVAETRPEFWLFAIDNDPPWPEDGDATWGLRATGALNNCNDGAGIKIAILDTGFDFGHPDFAGRTVVSESFVPDETADDVQGHGTHCAGTATGPRTANGNVSAYGVAPAADLFVGKVLNNGGSGREFDIVAGIDWAIQNGCEVISMSLGRATRPEEPFDDHYEDIAQIALENGCLIVAAAGNESARRFGFVAPVGAPANAPSIMAVAAVDAIAEVADFSCGSTGSGSVDVCAPGVSVFSSVPRPQLYKRLNGTSMACPHVAGIAALWAQSDPALRGQALRDALVANAKSLTGLGSSDVGAGLVQAP